MEQVGKHRLPKEERWWNKSDIINKNRCSLKKIGINSIDQLKNWVLEENNYLSKIPKDVVKELKNFMVRQLNHTNLVC